MNLAETSKIIKALYKSPEFAGVEELKTLLKVTEDVQNLSCFSDITVLTDVLEQKISVANKWECASLTIRIVNLVIEVAPEKVQIEACKYVETKLFTYITHEEARVRSLCSILIKTVVSKQGIPFFRKIADFLLSDIHEKIDERKIFDRPALLGEANSVPLDDTTGWRTLESSLLNLISLVDGLVSAYALSEESRILAFRLIDEILLPQDIQTMLISKTSTHVNRHVRKAGLELINSLISCTPSKKISFSASAAHSPSISLMATLMLSALQLGLQVT